MTGSGSAAQELSPETSEMTLALPRDCCSPRWLLCVQRHVLIRAERTEGPRAKGYSPLSVPVFKGLPCKFCTCLCDMGQKCVTVLPSPTRDGGCALCCPSRIQILFMKVEGTVRIG